MIIGIVGLGLIGGSLAKAFKARTSHTVIGYDLNHETTQSALRSGAVDEVWNGGVFICDFVFVALNPVAAIAFLEQNADQFEVGTIVTDVCGVKAGITCAAEEICSKNGLLFVGGHPMAGREVSGFENAVAELFVGRSYILTPTEQTDSEALERLKTLVLSLGISGVTITTPEHHDEMIAFTSQLPHIMAGAYMKSPRSDNHRGYSAGSYYDVSRVASVDEALWTELFLQNADHLSAELDRFILSLSEYKEAIAARDAVRLNQAIKQGRILKQRDLERNGNEKPHSFG